MKNATTMRVATDVGGTFTDLVCFESGPGEGNSKVHTHKSDTTPPDFENGVLDVFDKAGVSLVDVTSHVHGTTVVINALTERKGSRVGLIATEGFRDTLEIARGNRPDFFNLNYEKPPPFVPRYLRYEVGGRMSYRGEEMAPLDLSNLDEIIDSLKAEDVEAVAVCLLHSWANASHEQAVADEVRLRWPEAFVVASSDITSQWREYERTSTAVLSAYVQPVAERYLYRLDSELSNLGLSTSTLVMQSNCGVGSVESAARLPITMVESGPASGFWGVAELGRLIGEPNMLGLDIGGTTAKCSLIENGRVKIVTDYWIERDRQSAGYPAMVPVVDLVEIGNGGGSIAWIDDFGKLHVGPQSAGALPGPAGYGKGGVEATTTDANLWLGRIGAKDFCGGEVEPDMDATEKALRGLSDRLAVGVDDVARGIVRIANNNMVNALKLVSINRGFDPRDFTMVAFGGGGPMHAMALAEELHVKKVVIPAAASVFSAWGMIMSNLRRDYFVTRLLRLEAETANQVLDAFEETKKRALSQFAAEGIAADDVSIELFGKFRYQNQEHTTEVLVELDDLTSESIPKLIQRFHETYRAEYTYQLDALVEMVGVHLVASSDIDKLTPAKQAIGERDASTALTDRRTVDFAVDGVADACIYRNDLLRAGMGFDGPAVVEGGGTSVLVHPSNTVTIDEYLNLHIELAQLRNTK